MNVPSSILVPVDLSPRSRSGLIGAAILARRMNASVVIHLNVNLPEEQFLIEQARADDPDDVTSIAQLAAATLERWGDEFLPDLQRVASVTFADHPADGILDAIEASDADLVVMTSHGRSGLSQWILGSVTQRVVRDAPVPVMIIPAGGEGSSEAEGSPSP